MRQKEDFDQVLRRHPCVDLCGGDPSVAEHYLDRAKIGPALHHVGGSRMAKRMGRHCGRVDSNFGSVKSDDPERRDPAQTPSAEIRENRVSIGTAF
jgi:hypothetical protein